MFIRPPAAGSERMFWSILDDQRRRALPALGFCREEGFYLAGGTALALQIGHRDSVDFDFFTHGPFDTTRLFERLLTAFAPISVVKVQDERNTPASLLRATSSSAS